VTVGLPFEALADSVEVVITDQLAVRPVGTPNYPAEKLALQQLADVMADQPSEILPRLVGLTMDMCNACSAGVSVLEPGQSVFRWVGLSGVLSVFEGATTPRDFSPCGVCLDREAPVLMRHPERVYDWIRDAGISVPEVLLVPLLVRGAEPLGTLWVVAREGQHFDAGSARVLSELASFAGAALRMAQNEEKLAKALHEQETLTHEMSHRLTNVFAIVDGLVGLTAQHAKTKDDMAATLRGRIRAFGDAHALVKRTTASGAASKGISLVDVVERILSPYGRASDISGPSVLLSEQATSDFALVFHELATNAAKYGALSRPGGSIAIVLRHQDGQVAIHWHERGGPEVSAPTRTGFGSTLVETAMTRHDGAIAFDWNRDGLHAVITAPMERISQPAASD
jgi:two-component sensor histidine kinase